MINDIDEWWILLPNAIRLETEAKFKRPIKEPSVSLQEARRSEIEMAPPWDQVLEATVVFIVRNYASSHYLDKI